MRSFRYRPGKNAALALFMGAFGAGAGWLWMQRGGVVLLIAALTCCGAAVKAALNAFNSEPVLKFDRDRLWVRSTYGKLTEVPWREVHRIALEVFTVRYWGFIPIGRTEIVAIACEGGMFGTRTLRISPSTIELPPGGAAGLVLLLQQAHVEAVGAAGVAMAGAGKHGWGVGPSNEPKQVIAEEQTGSDFDPDAAIARYLASKETGAQVQAAPTTAAVQAPMPQRPVFGRKAG